MEQAMQQETSVSGTHSDSGGGFAGIVKDPPSLLLTEDPLAGWDVSGSAVVICLLSRLASFKATQVNFSYKQLWITLWFPLCAGWSVFMQGVTMRAIFWGFKSNLAFEYFKLQIGLNIQQAGEVTMLQPRRPPAKMLIRSPHWTSLSLELPYSTWLPECIRICPALLTVPMLTESDPSVALKWEF